MDDGNVDGAMLPELSPLLRHLYGGENCKNMSKSALLEKCDYRLDDLDRDMHLLADGWLHLDRWVRGSAEQMMQTLPQTATLHM